MQVQRWDRISFLPQDIIENILTYMPIRDAIRTSILSKKWRYCWTGIPKLVFDDREMVSRSSKSEEISKYKFVTAIFHVLLLHRAPILEFSLSVIENEIVSEIDLIINHLSRSNNNIKKCIFMILVTESYVLPCSFYSLQTLEHLDLSYCALELPLMNKGFSMLKILRFFGIYATNEMVLEFLTNCPLLEEFTWNKEHIEIEHTECNFVELFKCLPSIQVLEIFILYNKHLVVGCMPHKLPNPAAHLRVLVLNVCYLELSSVLCVISSSPNLEKIELEMCWSHDQCLQQTFANLLDPQNYSDLNLDHLKEMEIIEFHNYGPEIEFVKLIMANSPELKQARIELNTSVSVDEENKMLRCFLSSSFPRASPTANFIIKRPTY